MSTSMLLGTDRPLQELFDAALVDLDGVAYRGPHAIPTAPPALDRARSAGMGIVFVTNNASREPEEVAAHLTELGIPAGTHEVLTAAQAVARLLADNLEHGATVLPIGGKGLTTALREQGFALVASADEAPTAVVQGFDPDLSWRSLAEAAYAVRAGAQYFASNLDLTIPNERGIAPGNGSLVQTVVNATGVEPVAAGKPEPTMFHLAAAQVGSVRPLGIGDRLDTDLKGARAAGMPGLLVLTGVSQATDAILAPADQRPSFIGADLDSLAYSHPSPHKEGQTWHVGQAYARVVDARLEVGGAPTLDRLRAACVAAWESADHGSPLGVQSIPDLGVIS